jgi:hypothetical protein
VEYVAERHRHIWVGVDASVPLLAHIFVRKL